VNAIHNVNLAVEREPDVGYSGAAQVVEEATRDVVEKVAPEGEVLQCGILEESVSDSHQPLLADVVVAQSELSQGLVGADGLGEQ
jgi:hypothetical protein